MRLAATLLAAVAALGAASPPAAAQSLRTVVVPGDAGVVVAPRSAAPRLAARPPGAVITGLDERGAVSGGGLGGGTGLGPVGTGLALLLPLAAGALLGAGIANNNGGGTSGPARTR